MDLNITLPRIHYHVNMSTRPSRVAKTAANLALEEELECPPPLRERIAKGRGLLSLHATTAEPALTGRGRGRGAKSTQQVAHRCSRNKRSVTAASRRSVTEESEDQEEESAESVDDEEDCGDSEENDDEEDEDSDEEADEETEGEESESEEDQSETSMDSDKRNSFMSRDGQQ